MNLFAGKRLLDLLMNVCFFITGERHKLDACPEPRTVLFTPHQYAAFISSNALFKPYKPRFNLAARFDPDSDDADIDDLGVVVYPLKPLKGDDPHRAFTMGADGVPTYSPVLIIFSVHDTSLSVRDPFLSVSSAY